MQWSALPLTNSIGRHLTLTSISGRLSTLSPIPWSSRALSRTVNYRTSAWYRVRHSPGDSISGPTPTARRVEGGPVQRHGGMAVQRPDGNHVRRERAQISILIVEFFGLAHALCLTTP